MIVSGLDIPAVQNPSHNRSTLEFSSLVAMASNPVGWDGQGDDREVSVIICDLCVG